MRKFSLVAALALMLGTALFINCGSSSDSSGENTDTNPGFTSLDQLPTALSRVVSEDTAASITRVLSRTAVTGMILGHDDLVCDPPPDGEDADDTAGPVDACLIASTSSMAACETFNQLKSAVAQASQGDTILCYIQVINEAIAATGETAWGGIDIYDGSYHVFDMDTGDVYPEGFGPPDKVKLKITKDTSGYITDFEMFSCRSSTQDMYIHQAIGSDGTFTMENYNTYDEGENNGSTATTVAGTVNDLGLFVGSKTINVEYINSWSDEGGEGNSESMMTFIQSETSASMSGFMTGTGGECDFTNRAYGVFQMLDTNELDTEDYDIGLLAQGDGATQYALSGTCDGTPWSETGTESWNGDDTTVVAAGNDYTATAEASTVPSVETVTDHGFGDNTWDCSDTAEGTIAMADLFTEGNTPETQCEELDYEWINCWDVIENN